MFLKTVPPVAVHSEWRSAKSLSLPFCFNDSTSDSDFATSSGSPIAHKVQMIIDGLRSTQSSDMSDKVPADASAQSGFEMPRHGGRTPHLMEALTRPHRTDKDSAKLQTSCSDASESSDSDDSVDRGIEEAIQEYLKEKVDHKHKTDPKASSGQITKVRRGGTCMPDSPKQLLHINKQTSSNSDVKGSTGIQPLVDLKKKSSKENQYKKTHRAKILPSKAITCSWVQRESTSFLPCKDKTTPHIKLKVEQEEFDSSSDDGIEEAIQKFQQKEKERHENFLHQDSSSDDGIEEAIQHYQQEKEHKLQTKPSLQLATQHTSIQPHKNLVKKKSSNNRKKNVIEQREVKCASPRHVNHSLNMSSTDCLKAREKVKEPFVEQQIHSTLMVTTTAELMCAEAILDISKTVMPAAFEPTGNLAKSSVAETSSLFSANLLPQPDEKTDESSVDSEDGIEQEIRKFLEHKAKLHEHGVVPTSDCSKVLSGAKASQNKNVKDQSKALRLSLSRKRKHREVDSRSGKKEIAGNMLKKEAHPKDITQIDLPVMKASTSSPVMLKHSKPKQKSTCSLTEDSTTKDKDSSSVSIGTLNSSGALIGLKDSSDKSSSLDSDEDLDAAIKDLLKTKKKVKKKVRDLKLKTQKCLMATQLSGPDKKHKPVTTKLLKTLKCSKSAASISGDDKHKVLISQESSKMPKQSVTDPVKGPGDQHRSKMTVSLSSIQPLQVKEDSSSVDSDDSIEQEIRRFLAEKAKVSPMQLSIGSQNKDKETVTTHEENNVRIKEETSETTHGLQHTDPMLVQERPQQITSVPANQPRSFYNNKVKTEGPISTNYCVTKEKRTCGQVEKAFNEQRRNSLDIDKASESERQRDRTSSDSPVICAMAPQEPECQAQHQNLFLMKPENYNIDKVRETTPLDLPSNVQNRDRIPLKEVISTVCPSPLVVNKPISFPLETPIAAREHWAPSTDSYDQHSLHSCVQRGQRDQPTCLSRHSSSKPPHQSVQPLSNPSHLSCVPLPLSLSQPHFGASVKRLRRDQVTVLAQPAIKTNHVQLRNVQEETERMSEGKEKKQEKCIDETDVESGEERRPEQQRTDKKSSQTKWHMI
ncbi:protein phosphatase 1 regulatory subunit 26 isoform X2 [Trichomycterus rosablanca]|uniref:protein phosphatase 1 regulatory subunit 26 isoform X2 n=1 Tax=Trichomycterus rosablanca TaxID=2290929 RepID=UPI002F34FD1E